LVVDVWWWDGLGIQRRWTKDKGQKYYTELAEVTEYESE
jgi:hypothetical protein